MYPLYFYICLLASVSLVVTLILLAIYPVKLPLVAAAKVKARPKVQKARSPTRPKATSYWDDLDSDEDDL